MNESIPIIYNKKQGGMACRVMCGVECVESFKDESGPYAQTVEIATDRQYLRVDRNGVSEIQVTPKNMSILKKLIARGIFSLKWPQHENNLYVFDNKSVPEIAEELKQEFNEKKIKDKNDKIIKRFKKDPEKFPLPEGFVMEEEEINVVHKDAFKDLKGPSILNEVLAEATPVKPAAPKEPFKKNNLGEAEKNRRRAQLAQNRAKGMAKKLLERQTAGE